VSVRDALTKQSYLLCARLGDPAHPAVLTVARCTYANRDGNMVLIETRVELLEELPGPPDVLAARLAVLRPVAQERAREALGQAVIAVDVSRSPEWWISLHKRVPVHVFSVVTTGARVTASNPYWLFGRLNLLSYLAASVAQGLVKVAAPPVETATVWGIGRIREALAAARVAPPPSDTDSFLTETTTMDDAGLVIASAVWWAKFSPGVEVTLEDRPVRFAAQEA
jgi:hypothetical protein